MANQFDFWPIHNNANGCWVVVFRGTVGHRLAAMLSSVSPIAALATRVVSAVCMWCELIMGLSVLSILKVTI